MRARLEELPSPRRELELQAFNRTNAESAASAARFIAAERDATKASNAILDLAERNLGATQAVDGQILFSNEDALSEFNGLLAEIDDAIKREEVARIEIAEQRTRARQMLSQLKRH